MNITSTPENTLFERFRQLEKAMSAEKGGFTLFVLALREEAENVASTVSTLAPGRWDVIVSAPWLNPKRQDDLNFVVTRIKELDPTLPLALSRLVALDPVHPAVVAFNSAVEVEHGDMTLQNVDLFGQFVRFAYVITSKHQGSHTSVRSA